MRSLQWRMLAALCFVIALAWAISISMFVTYLNAGRENFWQTHLHSLGDALLGALPESWKRSGTQSPSPLSSDNSVPARPASGNAEVKSGDPEGILTAMLLNTLELAVVGLLIWWAIVASLRPLKAISTEIGKRKPFDSTPLPVNKIPSELQPLISGFNALLERVDDAMRAEHQFIADAAHELRTPLAALHVQAEVALGADTLERKDVALKKLIDISRRSHRLAEQLLDLARLDAGLHSAVLRQADLLELSNHVASEFSVLAADRGTRLIISGVSCLTRCDVDEIGILVRNLVDNAIRHGRNNGTVEVRCDYLTREGCRHPVLEVRDDGPGVPEEELGAIFARFYRARGNATEGSGIGLSLVAGIAKLHEAAIETSKGEDGVGLRVRVVFPSGN